MAQVSCWGGGRIICLASLLPEMFTVSLYSSIFLLIQANDILLWSKNIYNGFYRELESINIGRLKIFYLFKVGKVGETTVILPVLFIGSKQSSASV